MARGRGPWRDGFRAWERLNGWHQDRPHASPGHPDDGDEALDALADIGLVRHLLDQAELVAVKTARGHRKSWAEIATKLGVTRQSAWERWRDLDGDAKAAPATSDPAGPSPDSRAAVQERAITKAASDIARSGTVVVPDIVGLTWEDAHQALRDAGLVAISPDPDGPPLPVAGSLGYVVVDQKPTAGTTVTPGSPVALWIDGGPGSAGVREPRRPRPSPTSVRGARDETADEAVA